MVVSVHRELRAHRSVTGDRSERRAAAYGDRVSAITGISVRSALGLGPPVPGDICEVTIPESCDRRELRHVLSLLGVDPDTVPLLFRVVDAGFEVEPLFRISRRKGWHKVLMVSFGGSGNIGIDLDMPIDPQVEGVILGLSGRREYAEALEPLRDVWEVSAEQKRETLEGY